MATVSIVAHTGATEVLGAHPNRSTAHANATAHSSSGQTKTAGSSSNTGDYIFFRYFLKFVISLPSGSVITRARIRLTPIAINNIYPGDGDWAVSICRGDWSPYDPINAARRQGAFSLAAATPSEVVWANVSQMVLNTQRLSPNLSLVGYGPNVSVYYILRQSTDIVDLPFNKGRSYGVVLASPAHATAAYRPQLVLEYTEGKVPSQAFLTGL